MGGHSELLPGGDQSTLEKAVKKYLKAVARHVAATPPPKDRDIIATECMSGDVKVITAILMTIALDFLSNRKQDDLSWTDHNLVSELEHLEHCSSDEIGKRMRHLPKQVVDALCGLFPGHRYELETYNPADDGELDRRGSENIEVQAENGGEISRPRYLQHDDHALRAATVKNLSRNETEGLLKLRQVEPVFSIPDNVTTEELSSLVTRIITTVFATENDRKSKNIMLFRFIEPFIFYDNHENKKFYDTVLNSLICASTDPDWRQLVREFITCSLHDLDDQTESTSGCARRVTIISITRLLDQASLPVRRAILSILASTYPAEFRGSVTRLIDMISCQYGGGVRQRGKARETRRWSMPHAAWKLIVDALDAIWPPYLGPFDRYSKPAVMDILEATLSYADPSLPKDSQIRDHIPKDEIVTSEREGVHNLPNASINPEHVSQIASIRLAIFDLNGIMQKLDRELLYEIEPRQESDEATRQEAQELRRTLEALQTWRRELEERLRQGDYQKGAIGRDRARASGPRIDVPTISARVRRLPSAARQEAICTLALVWWQNQSTGIQPVSANKNATV